MNIETHNFLKKIEDDDEAREAATLYVDNNFWELIKGEEYVVTEAADWIDQNRIIDALEKGDLAEVGRLVSVTITTYWRHTLIESRIKKQEVYDELNSTIRLIARGYV